MKLFIFIAALALSSIAQSFSGHSMQKAPPAEPAFLCEGADPKSVDMSCLEEQLKNGGLGGWVHASVQDQFMFVFTWRRPGNFFINVQLPMTTKNPQVYNELRKLRRHDQVVLHGSFFQNKAPIQHINVTKVEVVQKYAGITENYQYDPELPDEIIDGNTLIGKVHAVANGGSVLVVEVGDRVYPVFNARPDIAKDLYRNDKISLEYTVVLSPGRPPHLIVNKDMATPVRVLENILDGHDTMVTLSGPLVMFPESPQIIHNVYALQTEDIDGVKRNYTLVNFQDIDLFFELRQMLEDEWNKAPASIKYDRNKFINPKIMVEATGMKHVVHPLQANPQIIINDMKDLKVRLL